MKGQGPRIRNGEITTLKDFLLLHQKENCND